MKKHKTIHETYEMLNKNDFVFQYQSELTNKLDNCKIFFDQNIINEIVLWKVSRYAKIDQNTLQSINLIKHTDKIIDINKTKLVLESLLKIKGIGLPMASTILRFKNKYIYQIIDQRVYRIIYKNKTLKTQSSINDKVIKSQIDIYLDYLKDLNIICSKYKIPFDISDRVLYTFDKRINKDVKLNNY